MIPNTRKYPSLPILVVDDETETLEGVELTLQSAGITHVSTCNDSRRVMDVVKQQEPAVIVLDLSMPHLSGYDLLETLGRQHPHIPVIILTGMNQVDTAVMCMKMGAVDYMVKPVEESRMISGVRRSVELREERREYHTFRQKVLEDDLTHPDVFADIITRNKSMRSIFQYVETIAHTGKPVLITGESGVGKELVAHALHRLSELKGEFVPLNVAGLEEELFSDTLFGHLKGAFTNADSQRKGLIRQASGGSLFLDEIGEISHANQLKLLRVLQEKEYYPVGADAPVEADVRFISATNKPQAWLQQEGRFRTDLYYRIQTHHIHLPPLRERRDDLPLLLDHFLGQAAAALGKRKPTPPGELVALLAGYEFPGNIREFQAMVFDAVSHHQKRMMSMDRFKAHIRKAGTPAPSAEASPSNLATPFSQVEPLPPLRETSRFMLIEALRRNRGHRDSAARMLNITRSGLNKALKRNAISSRDWESR